MSPRQRARRKGQGVGRRARRLACSAASRRVWRPATEREVSPGYEPYYRWTPDTRRTIPINVALTSGGDVKYSIRPPVIKDETFMPRAAIIMRMSDTTPPPAPDTTTFSIGRPDMEPT